MMTKEEYIESLRKLNPAVYLFGERIEDIPSNPILKFSVDALATTYEFANRPEFEDLMTATSHLTGERISRFTHIPHSIEDLIKKTRMLRLLGQQTGTCFQRCGGTDCLITTYNMTYETDQRYGTNYHDRFRDFLKYVQQNDLMVTAGVMDPKGDRSKRPGEQADPDLYLRVVEEQKDGIIVNGCKAHQTGGSNAHELLAMPCRNMGPNEEEYAVAFVIPVNTKGVYQIVGRQSCDTRKLEEGDIDKGNAFYGCVETTIIFDNVFVPWERVFLYKERDMPVRAMEIFGGTHRVSSGGGCVPGVMDIWIGAAATIAEYNGLSNKKHIQNKIAEMIAISESIRGCAMAACYEGYKAPSGGYFNDFTLGNVTKYLSSQSLFDLIKLLNYPAGGLPLTQPSEADLRSPEVGKFVEKYFKAVADVPTEHRLRMMRLIENCSIGFNNHLGELHGAGSPQTQLDILYHTSNLDQKKKLAKKLAGIKE